ncbi:MAG: MoaD/ThiS family protein [Candidatus Thiothrix putei]|uniref:Molybdopterin synthase sulfur carrier subunit n=2 Tax=Thiothrix TaxID=1030 RepID=A0A1H4EF93_9GAMM|nr:MoaD/ThiS family protein [Thiothrix caldifontis]WGZ95775.1 MAG: MoaD/ThiS family protein [Candidatus Thiothrix putei]SEA83459.1 molybdopterin synthase sulfur carrier subunit [Thiothrix caldifontis]
MPIKVLFFASLRERIGQSQRLLESDMPLTLQEVWQRSSGESHLPGNVLMSINQTYANASSLVQPGDEVAFFPPVTGG